MSNPAPALLLAHRAPPAPPTKARTRAELVRQIGRHIDDPIRRSAVITDIWRARTEAEAHAMARQAFAAEAERREDALASLQKSQAELGRLIEAAKDVIEWIDEGAFRLETVADSLFHKIGVHNTIMFVVKPHPPPPEIQAAHDGALGVFLVQHDWAALMDGADVDVGAYRLPFDYCVFEFQMSGRRVCVLVVSSDGEPYRIIPLIRARGGWVIIRSLAVAGAELEPEGLEPREALTSFERRLASQVRAIAITLDAEVVTAEAVRAPEAMNAARLRRNSKPVYDHHVLRLARRPRLLPPGAADAGSRRRLHFRRGHWRRYPKHKTWIRWCLVGDPALGFADKDYRL